jgi:phospholipase/carboxylesterase
MAGRRGAEARGGRRHPARGTMTDAPAAPLPTVEVETGPAPRAAVIWLHGLGADGHDFEPVVPELGLPRSLAVRFVFPHAPMRPVTINRGYVMRAWYDVRSDGGERREDEEGVRASHRAIAALIAREGERGVPAARIALAGFSQGGAMALHVGARHPERLATVVALSCFLPMPQAIAAEASPASREVPFLMAHGTLDDLVPVSRGRRARDVLLGLGYRVEWHEYPIPHAVSAEEIALVGRHLASALADPGQT